MAWALSKHWKSFSPKPNWVCWQVITRFPRFGQSWFAARVTTCCSGMSRVLMALASLVTCVGRAAAEPEPSSQVAMSYVGEHGCPTASTFGAGLRRLMPHVTLTPESGLGVAIEVTFERRHGKFVGRLRHGDTYREVTAAECADAAYALAVVTAIALDPQGRVDQTGVVPEDFEEPEVDAPPMHTNAVEAEVKAPEQTAPTSAGAKRRPISPSMQPEVIGGAAHWSVWLGPRASFGELGTSAWGADLAGLRTGETLLGAYRIGLRASTAESELAVTTLSYTRLGIGLEWCPHIGSGEVLRLRVCAGADVGWERISTDDTGAFVGRAPSAAFSLGAILDATAVVALDGGWSVAIGPGLVVPITRNQYVVEASPGVTMQGVRHSPVVATGGLQVGYAID